MAIDKKFWSGRSWDGHRAFKTIGHEHVSCWSPADGFTHCDLAVVECQDGRYFIEDSWDGDARGDEKVWNSKSNSDAEPYFFTNEDEAIAHACAVVAKISGVPIERVDRS